MSPKVTSIQSFKLGKFEDRVQQRLITWRREHVARRIWEKDFTVWSPTPLPEITDRLGWLTLPRTMETEIATIDSFADEVKAVGIKHVVLLGQFDTHMIVASQNLADTARLAEGQREKDLMSDVGRAFETYREKVIKAAEAQIEIGLNEGTGLQGEIRGAALQMEELLAKHKDPLLDRSLLSLRRYEKDYLQREQEKYVTAVNNEVKAFNRLLANALGRRIWSN